MNVVQFKKVINRVSHAEGIRCNKRKVGFCVDNPDGSHDFYEIEPEDIELGHFEDTDLTYLCLCSFKGSK